MLFKISIQSILFLSCSILYLTSLNLQAQSDSDSLAYLTRFKVSETSSYRIPMTKFCLINGVGLSKGYTNGWVMEWEIVKKTNSNLLFLEMNSTDVRGWLGNDNVRGSVQLVFELPSFNDSIILKNLTNETKGLYVVNNYGGIHTKREYLNGDLTIKIVKGKAFVTSNLNLITEKPDTKQQFILRNNFVPLITFTQSHEIENKRDSAREVETQLMVNILTKSISSRDSLWDIANAKIKDSLKLHPYMGEFRFWASDVDKAGNSRTTYTIDGDSLIIKEGPYDFIYLAKNYIGDSVYFKKKLNQNEKKLLAGISHKIESDSLKNSYANFCILDGLILSFNFESAEISKDVTVSNFYNDTIAFVVDFINKISPKKYQLWYNKKILLKQQNDCDIQSK